MRENAENIWSFGSGNEKKELLQKKKEDDLQIGVMFGMMC